MTVLAFAGTKARAGNGWQLSTPPARTQAAMAYDAAHGRVVLFGGQGSGSSNLNDTWDWNGAVWTQRATSGPAPRYGHAMAYDAARGRIVLFGGSMGFTALLGDTWEWDGTTWTQRATSGPLRRYGHAMAYDAARGRVVLFGGSTTGSTFLDDTWEWDGTAWTQRVVSGPAPRDEHAMAYDAARGRVVLFGGHNGQLSYFDDTWEWDGAGWTLRATSGGGSGPAGRSRHALAYDASRGRVVLVAGWNGSTTFFLYDTWEWDGTTWTYRSGISGKRYGHAIAYDSARNRIVMFGGWETDHTQLLSYSTWEWDGSTWRMAASSPSWRADSAMTYDAVTGRSVLFGGNSGERYDPTLWDTWEWDGTSWLGRASLPAMARSAHAMAYDAARGRVVLFGGVYQYSEFNPPYQLGDTWEWDGNSWTQRATSGPPPRESHAMTYDAAHGRVVLFGGVNYSSYFDDTWEWDGTVWTQRAVSGPEARYGHAMAYDAARGRAVLFGGVDMYGSIRNDTWEWDGATWILRSTQGPGARYGHAMVYDAARGRVVLFGGGFSDTWEWDGTSWSLQVTPGPKPGGGTRPAMAYDETRGRVVFFEGFINDTWEYTGCDASEQPGYATRLFAPICTTNASGLTQDVYSARALGVVKSPNDRFFLSSQAKRLSPLVVDDAVHIDGADSGLGPYGFQPSVPPYTFGASIASNFKPSPARDVTELIPPGENSVLFELLDTNRSAYGNTPVYLVRDCGIWLDRLPSGSVRLNWVSSQVEIGGAQSDLNVVSGVTSQLRADQDFSRACFLGTFLNTTQVTDTRPSPGVGDAFYYLVSGTCASPIGYGNSSQGPRQALPPGAACP